MNTAQTSSSCFDNPATIVANLLQGIPTTPLPTLGFLVCDSRIRYAEVLAALTQALPFPIVGGTTMLMPLAASPDETSACLLVFQREGLLFSVAISEPLDETNSAAQVQAVYSACVNGLAGPPKLFIPYIPLDHGLIADRFFSDLFAQANGIPVFGGITTDDLDSTTAAVFANGQALHNRMVLLALGGNIQPVFAMGSQLTVMTERAPTVTASSGNIVSRVDDMTFCEYMQSLGLKPEDRKNGTDALVQYGPLPVHVRAKPEETDGVPEIRCMRYTNVQDGSAAFSSGLPVGKRVHLGLILKSDVVESAQRCLDQLLARAAQNEAQGYRYNVLLLVCCAARYFAMVGGENLESTLLRQKIPPHLAHSSYYGFCEVGPTQNTQGTLHNRTNNTSIVMCAL